jgi:hypothetical protein
MSENVHGEGEHMEVVVCIFMLIVALDVAFIGVLMMISAVQDWREKREHRRSG